MNHDMNDLSTSFQFLHTQQRFKAFLLVLPAACRPVHTGMETIDDTAGSPKLYDLTLVVNATANNLDEVDYATVRMLHRKTSVLTEGIVSGEYLRKLEDVDTIFTSFARDFVPLDMEGGAEPADEGSDVE